MQRGIPNLKKKRRRSIQKHALLDHIAYSTLPLHFQSVIPEKHHQPHLEICWECKFLVPYARPTYWTRSPVNCFNKIPPVILMLCAYRKLLSGLRWVPAIASHSVLYQSSMFPESDIIRACYQRETAAQNKKKKKTFCWTTFLNF